MNYVGAPSKLDRDFRGRKSRSFAGWVAHYRGSPFLPVRMSAFQLKPDDPKAIMPHSHGEQGWT